MTSNVDPLPVPPVAWARVLLAMAAVVLLSHLVDGPVWESVRDPRVNDRDWGRLLRSAGYVPTWIFGAAALALASRQPAGMAPTGRSWRAVALLFGPALGGGVAELVKLAVRRQRPGAESAEYLFRPFDVDLWSTRGLGFASSHTAVAFAAAAILARCFPATRSVWYVLAIGCAVTRLLAGAHYFSDVVGGAVVGWLVAERVWAWCAARAHRTVAPSAP